ncbi:MAG: LysE family translocator [Brevundimonas sp.]|nr:MAG: LysE family translocator [Brevundimonas sp.]
MDWIVDPKLLPAFVLAMALVELTPGPNLAYLALLSASRGRGAGLQAVAGITLGLSAYLGLALFGLNQVPLHAAVWLEILRWAGAAYLLWLAGEAVWSPPKPSAPPDLVHSPFLRGMVSNLLNPKAAIFYLALLPTFIRPGFAPVMVQGLVLGGIHIAISVAIHSAAVFGAAGLASRMSRRGALWFRIVLAGGLVAAVLWLLSIPLSLGPAT